ncbi:hypothetical protein Salat_1090000 [Sesamum alatum]|uniref:Uncharacterized protein n=1 Tax=Sesamum alatum TaxID=300844 RepID=A0AAE2CSV7_9LAMI|nr:hypothetical protein Salat_1090000 [Sesamum alatum]
MPIPGNEPGGISGQHQVQQHQSISFSGAIPIKKRRFPIIQPASPSPEEKASKSEDNNSKNTQDSNIRDEGLSSSEHTASPGNSDASKTPASIVNKEEVTPTNIELGQANVETFASKPQEAKPSASLGPVGDSRNKTDILLNEKSAVPEVPESCMDSQKTNVKQETAGDQIEGARMSSKQETTGEKIEGAGMSLTNVELSLGPKDLLDVLKNQNSRAICHKSEKSDPSLLSLALTGQKLVLHDKNDSTFDSVSGRVSTNRSNWDLNTTMDAWEGSTHSDASVQRLVDIGGFSKINNCHDSSSSLTTAGIVGLSLNKGKYVLYDHRSNSSSASIQPSQQCKTSDHLDQQAKTDDSLGLGLALSYRNLDTSREHSALSDKVASISVSPKVNLQQVQLSAMNVNRPVKSEPVDENSKRDCSIGSCSSSNMGLARFTSIKRELVCNRSLETVFSSSIGSEKLVDHRSIKSEAVQVGKQDSCKSEDAILPKSVARVMQQQESCASSSATSVPLMPQNSCPSRLPTCSELTTSGNLSNLSEHSFHSKELHDNNDIADEHMPAVVSRPVSLDDKQLRPCKVGNPNVEESEKCILDPVNEQNLEVDEYSEVTANDEEKINISAEMHEKDSIGSDCESQGNHAADASTDIGENICEEDEEYEDGEVREPLQHSAEEDPIVEGKKTENLELAGCDSSNTQPFVLSGDQNLPVCDLEGKEAVRENFDETHSDSIKDCGSISYEPNSEDNSLQKLSDKVLEVGVDEKRSVSVTPEKPLDISGRKDVLEGPGKEVSGCGPTTGSHGTDIELGDEATDKVVKEICSGESDSTLSKVEASSNDHDAAKDSNNAGNKSRIINLSRASVVANPCKSRSISNRLLTSRSGKERYSDLDEEIQPRGNRDEIYTGGSNKFAKDRIHDQSLRNSRPNFMLGKGRISSRFGSLRSEWDSDHHFASETYNGPSDYRVVRRKHASSISEVELECNDYGIAQDGTPMGSNRRKAMNDEFPSLRRASLRRVSPGERDSPVTRGMHMLRRIPRNMSPSRCTVEDGSDLMGPRHGDKYLRHISDDVIDPVYSRSQTLYDELDGQLIRGNRNFSTLHRKGYPRIRSKSPVRSRTRSPGPWSSPRRRSPNGLPELSQHRSPGLYRMGRMRSPERPCFREEMVARRRGSPSYAARHPNDLRDVDSGREHVLHPRSTNPNRRTSPSRVFPRSARRGDALDSREVGDSDEYINGPSHSNKFHELRGDGSIDERRKFIERRGPLRPFRATYNSDNDNFRFHMNDGPRPYRFCPDAETEFIERSNMREREFDGRIKHQHQHQHQPLVVSRRIRNIEEQQDGNYRPVERVWHDEGFTDARVKRRRF